MNISITFRHMDTTDAVKIYANEKVAKLQRFLREPMKGQVTLSCQQDRLHRVEVDIHSGHDHFHAHETSEDMYASIDKVTDKIERQIRLRQRAVRSRRRAATARPSTWRWTSARNNRGDPCDGARSRSRVWPRASPCDSRTSSLPSASRSTPLRTASRSTRPALSRRWPRCSRKGTRVNGGEVERVLMEREQLQSTGIGEGVAIPHGALVQLDTQHARPPHRARRHRLRRDRRAQGEHHLRRHRAEARDRRAPEDAGARLAAASQPRLPRAADRRAERQGRARPHPGRGGGSAVSTRVGSSEPRRRLRKRRQRSGAGGAAMTEDCRDQPAPKETIAKLTVRQLTLDPSSASDCD